MNKESISVVRDKFYNISNNVYLNLHRWFAIVAFLAGLVLIAGFLFSLGGYLIKNSSYAANARQVYLNMFYVAFVLSFGYAYILTKYFECKRVLFANLIGIALSVLVVLRFGVDSVAYLGYVSILMSLFFASHILNRFGLQVLENWYSRALLAICSTALVFVPYLYGQKINPESFVVKEAINIKGVGRIKVSVNNIDAQKIIHNFELLEGQGFDSTPHPVVLKKLNNGLEVYGSLGEDLSIACLFVETNTKHTSGISQGPVECDSMVGVDSKLALSQKIAYLKNLDFYKDDYRRIIFDNLDEVKISAGKSVSYPNLEAMLIRGYSMHHYNSILQGYGGGYFDSFYNQYGFGPISVGKSLRDLLSLTNFDSVYVSIYAVNLLLLLVIVIVFGLEPIILIGYIFSLLVVYEYSAILAPFLYAIRAFPSILIALLLISKYNNRVWGDAILGILFFVAGIYNKEYGLITIATALVTGFATKDRKFYCYSAISMSGFLTGYYFANSQHIEGANVLALLLGVGFGGFSSVVQLVWPALICLTVYCVYSSQADRRLDKGLLFATTFLILASVKYITNPSPNHISFLFIVLAGIVYRLKLLGSGYANVLGRYFVGFGFSIVLLGLKNFGTQSYNTDLAFEYVEAPFSKIFNVEKSLVNSANEIKAYVNDDGFCVIAQNDDFYSVFYNKKITSFLPNFSTNINSIVDVQKGLTALEDCTTVFVSKNLLGNDETDYVITNLYNLDPMLNKFVSGYLHNVHKLKYLAREYVAGRHADGETKLFFIYTNKN